MAKSTDKAFGHCLAPVAGRAEADRILKENGVRLKGKANDKQAISAATVIQQIRLLNGGVCKPTAVGLRFNVGKQYSDAGLSQAGTVTMGQNHTSGNCSHIGHEFGHIWFQNTGLYGAYSKAVGICKMSNSYGNATLNENAAEAFAFFVTNPDHLRKSACGRKAMAFFSKHFKQAGQYAVCDSSKLAAAVGGGAGGNGSGGRTQFASLNQNTVQ